MCTNSELFEQFTDLRNLKVVPDLLLSVGGDGTFLETMLKGKRFRNSYCRG